VDVDQARHSLSLIGKTDPEVHSIEALATAVQIVGVVDRRVEDMCGGPASVQAWRDELARGRSALQLLDLEQALASFGLLDAELPCLTGLLSPGDTFRFYLSATELDLVQARSRGDDPTLAAFYLGEAERSARRAAAAGPYVRIPTDTLTEARELLGRVRAEQARQAPARVAVAGPAEQVWWDGTPADKVPFDVPAGTHVFQLTAPDSATVVAVQVVDLAPGQPVVVWARPDALPLTTPDLQRAALTLAESGRAPVGLAPTLRALSASGPSFVVTGDADQLRFWGADGDIVRLSLVDPPQGSTHHSHKRKHER